MKEILVTGGAGFIGSHTCVELCQAGFLPVVVDNFCMSERHVPDRVRKLAQVDFPLYELDCAAPGSFEAVFEKHPGIQGAIHFAAFKAVGVSTKQPRQYYENNVMSLLRLLEAMHTAGMNNIVFSSSCTVYGQPDRLPVTESCPFGPAQSPYGRTKQICEELINDVVASGEPLHAVSLRYFNPIGAHSSGELGELPLGKPETLVPYITQTAVGLREELVVFGGDYPTVDGTCVRDYIHIVDLARAHVSALNWLLSSQVQGHEVFNIGTGNGISVLQAIRAFETATGQSLRYRIGERRPGDVVKVYADASKAMRQLGWRAELSHEQALADAYRWQLALQEQ